MKIVTSLSFRGQCAEAFGFYAEVLGGKITAAIPYGDAPPGMPITDPKYKSWLMHCWLDVGDQSLMGADMDVAGAAEQRGRARLVAEPDRVGAQLGP